MEKCVLGIDNILLEDVSKNTGESQPQKLWSDDRRDYGCTITDLQLVGKIGYITIVYMI